ncbi:hypothetical protein YB2330_002012 [Saitoella coloradoensis]
MDHLLPPDHIFEVSAVSPALLSEAATVGVGSGVDQLGVGVGVHGQGTFVGVGDESHSANLYEALSGASSVPLQMPLSTPISTQTGPVRRKGRNQYTNHLPHLSLYVDLDLLTDPSSSSSLDPPRSHTRTTYTGFPTPSAFDNLLNTYIASLSPKKREKSLITQRMYDVIIHVLENPTEKVIGSAQFRFWVRKMFELHHNSTHPSNTPHAHAAHSQSQWTLCHDGKPVAVREGLYDILCEAHAVCRHGGRDKTCTQVKRWWSWVPKEVVARFVGICPTCRKSQQKIQTLTQADGEGLMQSHTREQGPAFGNPGGMMLHSLVHSDVGVGVDVLRQPVPHLTSDPTNVSTVPDFGVGMDLQYGLGLPVAGELPPELNVPAPEELGMGSGL